MECCFTARELVIMRSRLQWNAASADGIKTLNETQSINFNKAETPLDFSIHQQKKGTLLHSWHALSKLGTCV